MTYNNAAVLGIGDDASAATAGGTTSPPDSYPGGSIDSTLRGLGGGI